MGTFPPTHNNHRSEVRYERTIAVLFVALFPAATSAFVHLDMGIVRSTGPRHCHASWQGPWRRWGGRARGTLWVTLSAEAGDAPSGSKTVRSALENIVPSSKSGSDVAVREAGADEVKQLAWLVVTAFEARARASVPQVQARAQWQVAFERWLLWLQVFAGITDRLVLASFINGMALGEAGSATDTATPAAAARGGAAHALLTVSDASETVGVVELTTKRCPTPLAERGREAADEVPFVCNLAVAPGARGRGLARSLVVSCEARAADWGYSELFLTTDEDNVAALRLYSQLGYTAEMLEVPSGPLAAALRSAAAAAPPRLVYMRKRLSKDAPAHPQDALTVRRIDPALAAAPGVAWRGARWACDLSDDPSYVPLESNWEVALRIAGPLAPLLSILGVLLTM